MSRFPTNDKNMRTAYIAISTGPTQVVKPELVSFVMLCCRSFPLKSAITEKNHEKKIREHCKLKPIFHMIARDRRIAENTASNHQRLYENTFQQSGDRQRSSAIVSDYMETSFSDRVIVSDYMETLFSDRAIVSDYMETLFSNRAIVSDYMETLFSDWAIVSDYMEILFSDRAIVSDYMETLFSDRAIVSDYMDILFSNRAIVRDPTLQ